MRWFRRIAIALVAATLLFAAMLALGVPIAWEIAFGGAYCLGGYPPCGTRE